MKTFTIPAENLANLVARIEKISRRAVKLGAGAVGIEVGAAEKVPVKNNVDIVTGYRTVHTVTVTGETPKLAGWTFAATLQHLDGTNIVRTVPGVNVDLTAYREVGPACEHCKADRRRNDTYVVVHEDGRTAQLGRNCISDFLGGVSPDAVAARAQYLIEISDACDYESGFFGGRLELVAKLDAFLAFVACAIREDGWLSRTKARELDGLRMATADAAWSHGAFPSKDLPKSALLEPNAQDIELATRALEHARETLGAAHPMTLGDYEHNLRAVIMGENVSQRLAGIAASVVPWYTRKVGEERERAARKASEHVGALGERATWKVSLTRVHSFETAFGTLHLHRFMDADGNVLVWKTGTSQLEEGKEYFLTGTVKEHGDYKGSKQTVLSRCAASSEPPAPKKARKAKAAKIA